MLRDNLAGLIEPMLNSAGLQLSRAVPRTKKESSDDRPQNALKIPARQGGIYTLPENVVSPFHAEPAQPRLRQNWLRFRPLLLYSLTICSISAAVRRNFCATTCSSLMLLTSTHKFS